MPVSRFTWLHLTDLHFGMSIGKAEWPGAEYAVLQDIKQSVSLVGGHVDVIIFTGDLTQKATAEEFGGVADVLNRIRHAIEAAGGGHPPLVVVPGNHDVDRTAANEAAAEMLRDFGRGDLRERFWRDRNNDYRKSIDTAFAQFKTWSAANVDWAAFAAVERDKAEQPGEFAVTFDGGTFRVGILALNTAATQLAAGDYLGKLTMSGLQANSLVGRPHEWSARHDACLLLTHHPPHWLDAPGLDAYRNQVAHPDWFDLHLCGHLHEQERTRVIRGGQGQLRVYVGRSLFGLSEFGEAGASRRRLFGYSFGQIDFAGNRALRFWPRADQPKQAGTWVVEADHTEQALSSDEGTPHDNLGPRRAESGTSPDRVNGRTVPDGWLLVDAKFLDERSSGLRPSDLSDYFEGQDPEWPAIAAGRTPMRGFAEELTAKLKAMRSEPQSNHLIVGPGGEGKTTALMQVAASLGREDGWRVLWRDSVGPSQAGRVDWSDLASQIDDGIALCIVIDDAHEIRSDLSWFLQRDRVDAVLQGKRGASFHLLLCAHKDDWERSRKSVERWVAVKAVVPPLSRRDAIAIVRAYRKEGLLGNLSAHETDDVLAEFLVEKAHTLSAAGEAALLGALIEARTGESLDIHVERILNRTSQATTDLSLPVAQCFIATAAANSVGLHRLREDVLREALQSNEQNVVDAIRAAAAELRLEGLGLGRTVRVRHGAIARRAVRLAFEAHPSVPYHAHKQLVFKNLSRAFVKVVPEFWRAPSASPFLDLSVALRKSDPEIAVAIAQGAVDGAPDNDHLRSRLSQTYRELERPDPIAAEATCRDFFAHYPRMMKRKSIRHLILEWAVASGERDDIKDRGPRNVWLALLSFSDQAGDNTVSPKHAQHLPTVTKGLTLIDEAFPNAVLVRAAASILAAGHVVPGTRHLDTAERLAGQASSAASIDDLGSALSALSRAAWDTIDHTFTIQTFLPQRGELTFTALARAIAEVNSKPNRGFRGRRQRRARR